MASAFSHVIVSVAIGKAVQPGKTPWWYWVIGAFLSAMPDLDVLGFQFGIQYGDFLGHRGFTHSIFFAVSLAALISLALSGQRQVPRRRLFTFFFLALFSHGVLDAMTNGGLGVAFLSPFSNNRYFFPFHPIQVSPLGVERFFSERGYAVIKSEAKWLMAPSVLIFFCAMAVHRFKGSRSTLKAESN